MGYDGMWYAGCGMMGCGMMGCGMMGCGMRDEPPPRNRPGRAAVFWPYPLNPRKS